MAISKETEAFNWLTSKRQSIESDLANLDLNFEKAKGFGLAATLLGILCAPNPLAPLILWPSLGCYLASVLLEGKQSGRIEPIPFLNKSLSELTNFVGKYSDEDDIIKPPKKIPLSDLEATEYELLCTKLPQLTLILASQDHSFEDTFKAICLAYHDHGYFPSYESTSQPTPKSTQPSLNPHLSRLKSVVDRLPSYQPEETYQPTPEPTFEDNYQDTFEDNLEDTLENTFEDSENLLDLNSLQFDLNSLRNIDEYPSLVVVAPPGSGKTTFMGHLIGNIWSIQNGDLVAFDPYHSEWSNFTVLSDRASIDYQIDSDLNTLENRRLAYKRDKTIKFKPLIRIIDETPVTFSQFVSTKNLDNWLNLFATFTRKLNGRLILISARLNAKALRLDATTRDSSTILFPGKAGCQLALNDSRLLGLGSSQNRSIATSLKNQIAKLDRPCLVYDRGDWSYFEIPHIAPPQETTPTNTKPPLTDTEKAVVDYCKTLGYFDRRRLQQASLRVLKGQNSNQIQSVLDSLVQKGYADLKGNKYNVRGH